MGRCEHCDGCCTLTTVYSSPSLKALDDLMSCVLHLFSDGGSASDLFYYGVFCRTETYANFREWPATADFEIPDELVSVCSTIQSRMSYVDAVIEKIMRGETDRPEWMQYIETETTCGCQAPSTFLRITAKNPQHQCLAKTLIEYLYSPSKIVTMLGERI